MRKLRTIGGGKQSDEQREPLARPFVGLTRLPGENLSMICQYCRQDVRAPCHDMQEMRHRALNDVERCKQALKVEMSNQINPSDGQSAGSL